VARLSTHGRSVGRPDDGFRIFINYRRDDTPGHAGRLYDALAAHFGEESVFIDVDKIDPGIDFKSAINQGISRCDALIAVIGPHWLSIEDSGGHRRLDSPDDYVRLEIEAALRRGVRVIPALVEGAAMPSSTELPASMADLAARNSSELGDGTRWRDDVRRLIAALDRIKLTGAEDVANPETEIAVDVPPEPALRADVASGSAWRTWATRRRAIAAAAAAAVVALGIVVGVVLIGGGPKSQDRKSVAPLPTKAMPSMPSSGPKGFPDAIESNLLLAHIPEKIRPSCKRAADLASATFLRSVTCMQQDGSGEMVTYSRAHSSDALRAYLLQRVMDAKLEYPTAWRCAQRRPAADEWRRESLQTHIEGPSRLAEGRVLCSRNGSTASIVWTDTPTKILAEAARPATQWGALYDWWRNAAGPERELGMGGGMGTPPNTPFPDAIEKELLLAHIPPTIRKTCARTTNSDTDVFLRAVRCSQGMKGMSVVYMYAHSNTALKSHANDRMNAAGLNYPTAVSCKNASAAADTWVRSGDIHHMERRFSRQAEGRVLCFVGGGAAFMEWTDNPTGIYAAASRPIADRAELYSWWEKSAGPGALEMSGMGKEMP
jgi:TIR domain